jgi:hypothetical protein
MPAFEWVHVLLRQQKWRVSLQPPDFCNIHGRPLFAKQPFYDDQSKVRLQPYIRTLFEAVASIPDGIR